MTALTQELFQRISVLPDDIQDMFAKKILQEMESYARIRDEQYFQRVKDSASLYAEIYENDPELQKLTESAVSEWPE